MLLRPKSPFWGAGRVRVEGLEPPCREAPDPKSGVSTNFTTPAYQVKMCEVRKTKFFPSYIALLTSYLVWGGKSKGYWHKEN